MKKASIPSPLVFLTLFAAGFLIYACFELRLASETFSLLRVVTSASAGWLAYCCWQRKDEINTPILVIVALLFNPFVTVKLDREIWQEIDLAVAGYFIFILLIKFKIGKILEKWINRYLDSPPTPSTEERFMAIEGTKSCKLEASEESLETASKRAMLCIAQWVIFLIILGVVNTIMGFVTNIDVSSLSGWQKEVAQGLLTIPRVFVSLSVLYWLAPKFNEEILWILVTIYSLCFIVLQVSYAPLGLIKLFMVVPAMFGWTYYMSKDKVKLW